MRVRFRLTRRSRRSLANTAALAVVVSLVTNAGTAHAQRPAAGIVAPTAGDAAIGDAHAVPAEPTPAPSAALPPGHPPLDENPTEAMPPGHPPVAGPSGAGTGMEQLPNFRQVQVPETFANEAPDLPPGVVLVRVVDAQGNVVPNAVVRMGSIREGETQEATEIPTRSDGVAQFERLSTGSNVAYRASVDVSGARFSSAPFQLPSNAGYRVQLVRFETVAEPRSVLIAEARVEIAFQDDRLIVVQRANLVNFSNMSLNGQPPHPVAFVPPEGLRFSLPPGESAFRVDEQSMGDQRVTEENGSAVLRGSIPPTGAQSTIPVVFQYRVKVNGSEADLDLSLPLPVLRATIVAQAPEGMHLEVAGMQAPEEHVHQGQRVLVTGRERMSHDDAPIDHIQIRLTNIPAASGPERTIAAGVAGAIALGAVFVGVRNRGRRGRTRDREGLEAERDRLMAEAEALHKAHANGSVGPETFSRRKRELALALAAVLQSLGESKPRATARKD